LELGEFHADHLHRGLRDFGQVHSVWKMNHRAPVNLRVVDLNSVLMVVMKVCLNQDVQGDQKSQQNPDVMIRDLMNQDAKMDDRLMDDQKMIHQMMDDRNYLVDLNFRDALPCAYSLISIEIYFA
jgi:hypothetical protein